jgi:hypothetical protein
LVDLKLSGLFPHLLLNIPTILLKQPETAGLVFISLLFCIGVYYLQINMNRLLVQSRKMWSVVFFFLMISILMIFMQEQHQIPTFHFIIIPIIMIITSFFSYTEKKFISSMAHWMLVALSFVIGYYSL